MSKRKPPDRVYLEQWPEEAQRDDAVHYEQTGYGDDMRGNTSRITVYARDDGQQARLDAISMIWRKWQRDACTPDMRKDLRVLATGSPKRELRAALKRWGK